MSDKLLEKYLIKNEAVTSQTVGYDSAYSYGGIVQRKPHEDDTEYTRQARKYRKQVEKDTAEKIAKILGGKYQVTTGDYT